jgi:hypothetical protein
MNGAVALATLLPSAGRAQEPDPQPTQAPASPCPDRPAELGRCFDSVQLGAFPRPADPWSLAQDVPGVVVDRVNVGGSETAQQSLLVSHGDGGTGAVWTLDGIDVTDPAATGFSSVFPDMDALDALDVRTRSFDVRVRTPGAQVGLSLRRPADHFAGAAHFRGAGSALQSENLTPELASRTFLRNRSERILEMGGEAGGPLRGDRLWLWGAAARNSLAQDTFTGHTDRLRTTSLLGKARLRLGRGMLSLLALRSEKRDEDRDPNLAASPAARWTQSGPTRLLAAEDRRVVRGVALLARVSWLDGGFRLEPHGGTGPAAYEDLRGVFQGSYDTFSTERRRLEGRIEGTDTRHWLGRDHELVFGLGYRLSPVETRIVWPGNQALGFERQTIFFRAFRLTGFALPTRAAFARSLQDQAEAYAQDRFRVGRFSIALGARLDRLSGHNRPSSIAANREFPELLPAVRYDGAPARFRWLDLLPRAALSWDAARDGSAVLRAGYAAYAGALGAGDVVFDNPIGRDYASYTYYWIDRNGDHAVERGELDTLRGVLASAGLDPNDPASNLSPNRIDAQLRSPRTHEATLSLAAGGGAALSATLGLTLRRSLASLWRPLLDLQRSDYAITGAVRGSLFGENYAVGYYAPASQTRIVSGDGRLLTNREGYRQDSLTLEATARGRVGRRLEWEAWGALMQWRERFPDEARAIQDPTSLDTEPLRDGGAVAVRPGGLGRGDVFVNARWSAGAALRARLAWRLEAAAIVRARDGFPIPYFEVGNSGDPTGAAKNVLVPPQLDSFRLPWLALVDARLSRAFPLHRGRLTAAVDVFNAGNASTTLQVVRNVELPAFDRPREIVRPRIVRLGLEYRF